MESQAKDKDKQLPKETTTEISSLNKNLGKKSMIYQGTLNHTPVKILIDSGAMGNFISEQAADHFSFSLHDVVTRFNNSQVFLYSRYICSITYTTVHSCLSCDILRQNELLFSK